MPNNGLILAIVAVFGIGIAGSVAALILAPADSAIPIVTAVLAAAGSLIGVLVPLLTQISHLRTDVAETKSDIRKVELATNSMKDALVEATAVASRAEGRTEGAAAERANPQVPGVITAAPAAEAEAEAAEAETPAAETPAAEAETPPRPEQQRQQRRDGRTI